MQFYSLEMEKEQLEKEISKLKTLLMENLTVNLGVTAVDDHDYNRTKILFENIVEKDVNDYCLKMGYNIKFRFIIKNNKGLSGIALNNTQEFKEMGINIIIGHPSSTHCYVSMEYVNKYNMLLFSSSAQSSQLARKGDNLLRMHPNDAYQGHVIAEMLSSRGVRAIIVIELESLWADGIYKILEDIFLKKGGIVLERVKYNLELTDFSSHLARIEDIAVDAVRRYGREHVNIVLLSYEEGIKIVKQAKDFSTLYSLYWFGSDSTARFLAYTSEASEELTHLKIFSPLPEPTKSQFYFSLNQSYYALTHEPLDFDTASKYDIAWILARAILKSKTTDVKRLLEVIPEVASMNFGASGWCKLDENGDRETANYGIYGYEYVNGTATYKNYGVYDGTLGRVFWIEFPSS